MSAVALAVGAAALFGAMTVLVRVGLDRVPDPFAGNVATVATAAVVATVASLVRGVHDVPAAWPFALAGVIAPGGSQILFTLAVRSIGASRSSAVVGAAPLVAVAVAFALLHEPVQAPLVVGAVAIVGGGLALVAERRPEHLRAVGFAFAAGCTVLFATRDNLVRQLATGTVVAPSLAAAVSLLAGAVCALGFARSLPSRAALAAFAPAGVCFGLSYLGIFEAFYRGRVSIVSPLVATETLWGVGLSALFLRRSELVGRRLLVGAALIVAGGVLIGVYR